MKYPVTVEQIEKEYEEVNGCKVPASKRQILIEFTNLLNGAYIAGFAAGIRRSKDVA